MCVKQKLTKLEIKNINFTNDIGENAGSEEISKEKLLKQMNLWHKLTTQEEKKILDDNFSSDIERDNYVRSIIIKYL